MNPWETSCPDAPVITQNAASFLKENAPSDSMIRTLDVRIADSVTDIQLPFTENEYYDFCDRYLPKGADEALYYNEAATYYREITTDYDSLKYLSFLGSFYTAPLLCDLGCGIGNVLHYAGQSGFSTLGFEINKSLRSIHKAIGVSVLYGDLLTADLSPLRGAQIIYLYRPVHEPATMDRLLKLVHAHTGQDVVILYSYPHSKSIGGYEAIELGPYDANMILLVKEDVASPTLSF